MSIVSATEIQFDLSKLTAGTFPRVKGNSSAGALAVLPLVVTQCPYGPADSLATWKKVPWRKLAGVMRQLHAEAAAVRSDLKGWTFDMEKLTPEDLDFIDAAVFRGFVKDGARMIAKYVEGLPVDVMQLVQANRLTVAPEAAKPDDSAKVMQVPDAASLADAPDEDGTAEDTSEAGAALTAADVLQFPYYKLYAPLINRLREEAREEFNAGFLAPLSAPSGSSN